MRDYRFLIDNDSQAASSYFPEKRVVTFAQAKLSQSAPDSSVVATAHQLGCIIVTANGPDFEREIRRYLQSHSANLAMTYSGLSSSPTTLQSMPAFFPDWLRNFVTAANESHGRMFGRRTTW